MSETEDRARTRWDLAHDRRLARFSLPTPVAAPWPLLAESGKSAPRTRELI